MSGNLVKMIAPDKSAVYVYNAENKLVKATVQSGNNVVVETYTYDFSGNRTSKSTTASNGAVEFVKYLNDNSSLTNVLVELDSNGNEKCYYTIGADLISQEVDGELSIYLYNGHGTVRVLANESGKVTDTYDYDAFGNLISSTGKTANNYRYCGEQFDSTTGLYYLRARYMDTNTGRFISMDTYQGRKFEPVTLHKYLYASANPVMRWDPSGYNDTLAGQLGVVECIGIMTNSIMSGVNMAFVLDLVLSVTAIGLTIVTTYLLYELVSLNAQKIASGEMTSTDISYDLIYDLESEILSAKRKPPNLPSADKIKINIDHIMSGHSVGGGRDPNGNKDKFPKWMTAAMIERAIRIAYACCEKVQTQGDRVKVVGEYSGYVIEMWVNIVEKIIETAYPKF